jgi:hypothetical protein
MGVIASTRFIVLSQRIADVDLGVIRHVYRHAKQDFSNQEQSALVMEKEDH